MADIKIVVINESTAVQDMDVRNATAVLQKQVTNDFAPIWGCDADLRFLEPGDQPKPGEWWLVILDNSDQAGALGYHDITNEGLPLGKVFAGSDIQYGYIWTVTASHELLEMLGDPDINLTAFVQTSDTAGTLYAYETADACEADEDGYMIDGIRVSDFVYPAWFESFRTTGPFDHQGLITKPFELRPGGYIGVFEVTGGSGWTQKTPQNAQITYSSRARLGSRREKRRTARHLWLKSEVEKHGMKEAALRARVAVLH